MTPGGTAVLGGLEGDPPLQNLFPHASSRHATLFLAWLDGQPAAVGPTWRTVGYTLTVTPGRLDDRISTLGKLQPWPPKGQR